MQKLIENFPKQLVHALQIGKDATITPPKHNIKNIVIAGMGGSGIGGSLLEKLTAGDLSVPIIISKSYTLPHFVDQHTLFIASSFSGNTEETLSALEKAIQKKAKIVNITSGGLLLALSEKHQFDVIQIPGETKCPRAHVGYSIIQLFYVLYHLDLIQNKFLKEFEKTIALLEDQKENIQQEAIQIAKNLHGFVPVIYADDKLLPIAIRFQQQINENAKHFCHVNAFPEMNHNELVGWVYPASFFEMSKVILFRTNFDEERVKLRMDICKDIFLEKADSVYELHAYGDSFLEQCFYLLHLTDWVSFYLALENKVDPFPVELIDYLKSKLA